MKAWIARLSSRKFLAAAGATLTAFSAKQYVVGAAIVIGYLGAEGIVDAKAVNTAGAVEARAHDLATQLLDELAKLPPADDDPDDPRHSLPLKGEGIASRPLRSKRT